MSRRLSVFALSALAILLAAAFAVQPAGAQAATRTACYAALFDRAVSAGDPANMALGVFEADTYDAYGVQIPAGSLQLTCDQTAAGNVNVFYTRTRAVGAEEPLVLKWRENFKGDMAQYYIGFGTKDTMKNDPATAEFGFLQTWGSAANGAGTMKTTFYSLGREIGAWDLGTGAHTLARGMWYFYQIRIAYRAEIAAYEATFSFEGHDGSSQTTLASYTANVAPETLSGGLYFFFNGVSHTSVPSDIYLLNDVRAGRLAGTNFTAWAHADPIADPAVAATCTTDGKTEGSHCGFCGAVITEQKTVPASGHRAVIDPASEATCTENGKTEGSHCEICGEVLAEQKIIPAKGHTEAVDRGYPATCIEDGLTDGKHCTECGTVTVAQEVIRATGHKRVVTEAGYPATCTVDGMSDRIECSVCGAVLQEARVIRATGHKEVIDAGYPATCSSDGLTEGKHCSVCGEILVEQKVIPSSGIAHTPGHPATCTEGQYCLVCGEELAPAKGHMAVKIAAEAATCTRDGHTEGSYCSTCFEVLEAPEKIPAKGHTEVVDAAVAATCTEAGLTEGKHCSVCGEVLLYQYPTFPTGHREKIVEGKEATCTESGKTMRIVCETCGEVLLEQKVIPAKGHLASEATCGAGSECLRCGEALSAATGHRYADEHTCHDRVCENCGEIAQATTAHTGGNATCTERAVCANCGEAYGEKKAHTYADGVCTECKAQIAVLRKEEEGGCSGSLGIGSAIGLLITAAAACVLRKKRD